MPSGSKSVKFQPVTRRAPVSSPFDPSGVLPPHLCGDLSRIAEMAHDFHVAAKTFRWIVAAQLHHSSDATQLYEWKGTCCVSKVSHRSELGARSSGTGSAHGEDEFHRVEVSSLRVCILVRRYICF